MFSPSVCTRKSNLTPTQHNPLMDLSNSACFCVVSGYVMSCSVDQLAVLMAITPLIIVPLMLFGGYFLNSEYVMNSVLQTHMPSCLLISR